MDAGNLHVITCVSNPLLWNSRIRLYHDFKDHMLASGVKLTTVECVLYHRPWDLSDSRLNHIGVRHETLVWHKESLLNIALSRINAEYVAWIDADIRFRRPDWAEAIVQKLQQYPIIQPWEHAYDLGPNGEHMGLDTSLASLHAQRVPHSARWQRGYCFGHPGYAWAARTETLNKVGGLYPYAALGSADHNMAMAMLGRCRETFSAEISPHFTATQLAWQDRASRHIGGRLGYLPGTIEHSWHGSKVNRNYVNRWDILKKHRYNPITDVQMNTYGVMELTGAKPEFRHDIELYFSSRNEDANVVVP